MPVKATTSSERARYLTAAQLMEELQLSENTVYRELRYGFLKPIAIRAGAQWRVSSEALERLMAGES